jgi:hypothetical protein
MENKAAIKAEALVNAYTLAMEEYATHKDSCDFYTKRSLDACDCGLYAVMKGDLRKFLDLWSPR